MNINFKGIEFEFDASLVDASSAEIRRQITEFESGDRREFDMEIEIPDSFTGEVMVGLTEIPYGHTLTYGDLAAQIESSAIAVGQACGRNPIPIVVPCHRVVGKKSLGGFSVGGDRNLTLKQELLACENDETMSAQTTLATHR